MKLTSDHFRHIQEAIEGIRHLIPEMQAAIAADPRVHDPDKRLRWDCLWAAGLSRWLCDEVYPYANDEHIDTVLRVVMPGVLASLDAELTPEVEEEPAAPGM